jgi:GDSL-like Lipase/Acylhydrolase
VLFIVVLSAAPGASFAQSPVLVGMGDSIGEGVQSAEGSRRGQKGSYLVWIARQMGAEMPLPLIDVSPFSTVESTRGRRRIDATVEGLNLSVSGARVRGLLRSRATASTVEDIASERDLVLFPRQGSPMELVESMSPAFVVCWIGSNDVLSTATSFDQLDGTQMTSVGSFAADFHEIAQRLHATGANVVFGNIPDVSTIAFLMNADDLRKFLGSDYGLAPGNFTSLVAMLLIRLGLDDGTILQNPDFVLDASEVQKVRDRIAIFNQIIADEAAAIGAPVVNVHDLLKWFETRSLDLFGIRIGRGFNGGIFSLDGVHPSNVTHAVLAGAFLATMNQNFGTHFPLPGPAQLVRALLADPFVDKDGDLRVRGRPFDGALETFGPLLGISGDVNDFRAGPRPGIDRARGRDFMRRFRERKGISTERLDAWSDDDVLAAFRELFGLRRTAAAARVPNPTLTPVQRAESRARP